jgi:colanic acid/amylovoran biosynthesis glycosyltransferase
MDPMRLAVFTNQFPSRLTTFFARDMRALIECGVELDIFPIYPLDEQLWPCVPDILNPCILPRERVHHLPYLPLALGDGAQLRRRKLACLPAFLRDVAAIGRRAVPYGPAVLAKTGYSALCSWAWAQRHNGDQYDHILAYWGNYAATSAYLFHRLTRPAVPFSILVHARMDLYRQPVFLAEKLLYADNIFLVCEFNRGYLARTYPEIFPRLAPKIRIHHLGLELDRIEVATGPRHPGRVLAVGRFEPLKGFHCLLDAVAVVRRQGIAAELELVGDGEQAGELREQASRLGVAEHVRFRGWLSPDDVLDAMRHATVLAHPSIAPDAMPTVVKEALAVGTPVIASDLAGIPEMLGRGRCGILTPPGDRDALAAGLGRLLTDPELRENYARAGRAHAECYFDLWRNGRVLADLLARTPRRAAVH